MTRIVCVGSVLLFLLACETTSPDPDLLCGEAETPETCHCDQVEHDRWCRQYENVTPETMTARLALSQCDAGVASWSGEPGVYAEGACPEWLAVGRCAYHNGEGALVFDTYYEGFAGVSMDDDDAIRMLAEVCTRSSGLGGTWENYP